MNTFILHPEPMQVKKKHYILWGKKTSPTIYSVLLNLYLVFKNTYSRCAASSVGYWAR